MKIAAVFLFFVCIFSGCSKEDPLLDQATELRKSLLTADSCTFHAVITANYTDEIYTFQMECSVDNSNNLTFTVKDPATISGICGNISDDEAALTFDDKILAFPILADGQISPVSAPWVLINTLKGGYLTGCGKEENGACIYIDDNFEENPMHLQIYTDPAMTPVSADIFWNDRCILSMEIRDFVIR